jgi:hypothetical protein
MKIASVTKTRGMDFNARFLLGGYFPLVYAQPAGFAIPFQAVMEL